jgi:hypothetical protein
MSTFATISTLDLDLVTGGAASSSNDQTVTALQGITDQLSSLKNDSGKKSGFNDPATMMMFCLALSQRNQGGSNTTVIAGGGAPAPAHTVRTSTRIHW